MNIHHHFRTLGIDRNATAREAKIAYKRLIKQCHPDRFAENNAGRDAAQEVTKEINVAYALVMAFFKQQQQNIPKNRRIGPGLSDFFSGLACVALALGSNLFRWLYCVCRKCRSAEFKRSKSCDWVENAGKHPARGSGLIRNFEDVLEEVLRRNRP